MHPITQVSLAACHFLSLGSKYTFSRVLLSHELSPRPFSQTAIPIFEPSQQEKHVRLQYFVLTIKEINCITELLNILQDICYPQFVNDTRLV